MTNQRKMFKIKLDKIMTKITKKRKTKIIMNTKEIKI